MHASLLLCVVWPKVLQNRNYALPSARPRFKYLRNADMAVFSGPPSLS